MADIPVTFTIAGKQTNGHLSAVYGAGNNSWHLYEQRMKGNYYAGMLRLVNDKWVLNGAGKHAAEIESQVDYFAQVVIAWYQ